MSQLRTHTRNPPGLPQSTHYTVKRGDTLYSIARRHGVGVAELAQLNSNARPEQLRVGSSLLVPRGKPRPLSGHRRRAPLSAVHAPTSVTLRWPTRGVLTSPFGLRGGHPHDGIDIGAPRGSPVHAAADGEVLFADKHAGYGNLVILQHRDGVMTIYAHHEANLVRKGQQVRSGDPIAKVGATGRATGPHLHFEVRRGTRPDNPLHYLPAPSS